MQEQKPVFGSKPAGEAAAPVKSEAKENIPVPSNGTGVQDLGQAGCGKKRITPAAAAPDPAGAQHTTC